MTTRRKGAILPTVGSGAATGSATAHLISRSRTAMPLALRVARLFCVLGVAVLLSSCASQPAQRVLSNTAPVGAYLPNGAHPTDPSHVDPRIAGVGLIGAMEVLNQRPITILELSGGGQYGAFGAGVLNGWAQTGQRPQFDLVTGISTGALLATHAFLGTPADDAVLKEIYTSIHQRDIYRGSLLGGLLGGPALNKTNPMWALIEKIITPEVIERVAAQSDNNRRLIVAATNLDYKRVWVFSLSEIAKEGGLEALTLYRKVLYAAASPPVVFPPVEIDGHLFGDAAVRENLLLVGLIGGGAPARRSHAQAGQVYVIVNGRATTPPEAVPYNLSRIAGNAFDAILSGRMETTLVLAYAGARLHGYGFNMIAIPEDFPISGRSLAFDQAEMRRVFEEGTRLGRQTDAWQHRPPASDQLGPWAIDFFDRLGYLAQ